jgi:hypothetical protein
MSAKVSTFLWVGGAPYRYTFLLVVWNDYTDAVRDEINRQAEAFGADLGAEGLFVQPYSQRMYETAGEVLAKPWPDDIRRRLEDDADPVLLVLDHPFATFDPREHGFGIIWLSEYHGDPQEIRPVLQTLARRTKRGEDVIAYLAQAAERRQRDALAEAAAAPVGVAARLASYVEIKPRIFGVSIDLKALLRDIAERP